MFGVYVYSELMNNKDLLKAKKQKERHITYRHLATTFLPFLVKLITGWRLLLWTLVILALVGGLTPNNTYDLLKSIIDNIFASTLPLVVVIGVLILSNIGFAIWVVALKSEHLKPLAKEVAELKKRIDPNRTSSNLP